jgi:hypothetical protein
VSCAFVDLVNSPSRGIAGGAVAVAEPTPYELARRDEGVRLIEQLATSVSRAAQLVLTIALNESMSQWRLRMDSRGAFEHMLRR